MSCYSSRTCLCDLLSDFVVGRNGDGEGEKRVEEWRMLRELFFFDCTDWAVPFLVAHISCPCGHHILLITSIALCGSDPTGWHSNLAVVFTLMVIFYYLTSIIWGSYHPICYQVVWNLLLSALTKKRQPLLSFSVMLVSLRQYISYCFGNRMPSGPSRRL